jgi:signal transduction histidine kinase
MFATNTLLTQIEDSGRGIEKDVLDNLFDPYLRSTKEKSRSTGLGIGLALSKKYVELHKGKIWAESIAGKGTTISFVIPLFKAVNDNKPS